MKFLIGTLIFLTLLFSNEIQTIDNRSFKLKLHTMSWETNWKKHTIDYDELLSGGPSRDGIPPLDTPKFVDIQSAKQWLNDREPVIFVKINNEVKAYALQVLIWHEIVNDTLGDKKISVTFCPLCNASIVFDRKLDGKTYDFGTSGLLRHSDLVMYDRQTESLWQQFTGTAIVGDLTNKILTQIPSSIMSFKEVYTRFPQAKILSRNTGYLRDYGRNPYAGYDDVNQTPFMLRQEADGRMLPMQRVATVSFGTKDKAYSYNVLKKKKVVNDTFAHQNLTLFYGNNVASALDRSDIASSKDSGTVVVYDRHVNGKVLEFYYKDGFFDKQTNSQWNLFGEAVQGELKGEKLTPIVFGSHFWFAWAVFKPNTIIYK